MNLKNYCFSFKSYDQILEILRICKQNKIKPIFFVSYHLINGLGVDWLIELKNMLINQFNKNDYKFYVDSKRNYGLFIDLVETKVEFIKIKANEELCKKLQEETGVSLLSGSAFGYPSSRLVTRLAYVDFDGCAALEASEKTGLSRPLTNQFIDKYAPKIKEGTEKIIKWLCNE